MSKRLRDGVKERKEKEEYLYSAIYYACIVSKCPDMDHTVLPAKHHACLFFVSVYQMAPPLTEVADIQLQLTTTHLSTTKG